MNSHPADRLANQIKDDYLHRTDYEPFCAAVDQLASLAKQQATPEAPAAFYLDGKQFDSAMNEIKPVAQVPAAQSGGEPTWEMLKAGQEALFEEAPDWTIDQREELAASVFKAMTLATPSPQEPTVAQAALQGAIYEAKMSSSYRIGCRRLKAAVEGECDGMALTDQQAGAILEYISGWEESYSQKDVDAAIAVHKAAAQEGA